MKSFDEWFKSEMPNSYKKVGKEQIETVIYSCSESAWGYKQAEVDELRFQRDVLSNKVDELRKRIDDLDKQLFVQKGLNRFLKGKSNDN